MYGFPPREASLGLYPCKEDSAMSSDQHAPLPRVGIDPKQMASEMRRRAVGADRAESDYFLWLADEWEAAGQRFVRFHHASRTPSTKFQLVHLHEWRRA
jgi:hypothetical protein